MSLDFVDNDDRSHLATPWPDRAPVRGVLVLMALALVLVALGELVQP